MEMGWKNGEKERIKTMKKKILTLLILLALLCAALPACAQGDYFTAVIDGDTSDRVHLRAEPSTEAKSLGLYFTGTEVVCHVLDDGEWAEATIGAARGYMKTEYLSTGVVVPRQPAGRTTAATALLTEPKAGSYATVELVPEGESLWLLGETNTEWYYVQLGLQRGYIAASDLELYEGMGRPEYDEILAQYAAALRDGNPEDYWWVSWEAVSNSAYGVKLGYARVDMDANGIEELVIGETADSENDPGLVYGVFTLDNGFPRLLFEGWTRNAFYLCSDGQALNEWSNSAAESGLSVYGLEDGVPVVRYELVYNAQGECGEAQPWYYITPFNSALSEDNSVSEEFAQELIAALGELRMQLPLTAFE